MTHLLLSVLLVGLSGCGSSDEAQDEVAVTWEVRPDPPRVGHTDVAVRLTDSTGVPIRGADVSFEGTMSHPGMPPATSEADEVTDGRYEGSLNLSMGGDWIILLQARLPDGTLIQRNHLIQGVRPD